MGEARRLLDMLYPGRDILTKTQTDFGLESLGLTSEEVEAFWRVVKINPYFWEDLKPLAHTDLLPILAHAHDVHFITNRFPTGGRNPIQQTHNFLKRNFDITTSCIWPTSDKEREARWLRIDYMIDDRPDNLEAALRGSSKCRPVLVSTDYNASSKLPRVDNFNEFAQLILRGTNV